MSFLCWSVGALFVVCLANCASQQAAANVVSYDGDKCVRVNGKPFFAVGIYNAWNPSGGYPGAPDFAKLAQAFGCAGITVDKKADVKSAIKQMLAEKRACVVDFRVEPEENVWPMVPAGKSIDQMDGLDIFESMA